MRLRLENFNEKPPEMWRQTIDRYIKLHQPFRLLYHDAADIPHSFSIYYAKVTPHDKRFYLDCWCSETVSEDVELLQHNRCLRLDRIPESAITPIQGKWRSQLDQITVTFQLSGKLAHAYKPKPNIDIDDIWLGDPPLRQITRTISSTFWFYREIMPYIDDCEIIEPDDVREKFKEKVRSLYQKYH